MSENTPMHLALALAFRHFGDEDTTEIERDAVLAIMAVSFSGKEGETASRLLHHRREAAKLQTEMTDLLDGTDHHP